MISIQKTFHECSGNYLLLLFKISTRWFLLCSCPFIKSFKRNNTFLSLFENCLVWCWAHILCLTHFLLFFLLCVFLKALNQSKSINQYVNCLKRPNEQTLPFVEEMSHSSQRPDKNTLTVFAELLVLSFTVRFVCTFCQIIIQQLCPVHVMF